MPNVESTKQATVINKAQLVISAPSSEQSGAEHIGNGQVNLAPMSDSVASEQALQIMLNYYQQGRWQRRSLAVIMRTPSDDKALVFGYLVSQGVVNTLAEVEALILEEDNLAEVKLKQHIEVDWQRFERVFVSQSGCGVCGQSQLKQLALLFEPLNSKRSWLKPEQLLSLPSELRERQSLFLQTGGSHGAGLWQADTANDLVVAEDVGRHNAVDKLLGHAYQHNLSLAQSALVLSGRISFELVQKAVAARIPVIVAVGAPSDLAITTAKHFNIALIGFTKAQQANVYCGQSQLALEN